MTVVSQFTPMLGPVLVIMTLICVPVVVELYYPLVSVLVDVVIHLCGIYLVFDLAIRTTLLVHSSCIKQDFVHVLIGLAVPAVVV